MYFIINFIYILFLLMVIFKFWYNSTVLSVSSNGLKIPIITTGCPSCMFIFFLYFYSFHIWFSFVINLYNDVVCRGKNALSSGITTALSYQYGRFDFTLKYENKSVIPFVITWQDNGYRNGYFYIIYFIVKIWLLSLLFFYYY